MKKVCILTALLLLLGGCSGILDNSFRAVSPHAETSPEPLPDGGQLRAGTYNELKNTILQLVRAFSTEGVVRLHNYVGDVSRDVPAVCREVSRAEPIGAYALDFLSYEITPIISDYDVTLSLTYRRTHEQLLAVRSISGPAEFEEAFAEVVSGFATELTFETFLYYPEQYDFAQILNRVYYSHPAAAQGLPEISVSLYPDTGLRRVVEIGLSYPDTLSALKERSEKCTLAANEITDDLTEELSEQETALALYDALGELCKFDFELYGMMAEGHRVPATAYDALFGERALPEAYALAYKLLCDTALIPCLVVTGRRGADEHTWNLIQIDGSWYHADPAADDMGETLTHNYFLKLDSYMQTDYRWDTQIYPPADDGTLVYEAAAEESDELPT